MDHYLVMYNVKGIQKYIFQTNVLKEIIGASNIVENLINDAITASCKSEYLNGKNPDSWKNEIDQPFVNDAMVSVIYQGGGNTILLFQDCNVMNEVNTNVTKYILKNAKGLQLIVAAVKCTGDYLYDTQCLHKRMQEVTENMPPLNYQNGLPITLLDPQTGLPLTDYSYAKSRRVSKASYQKLQNYKTESKEFLDEYPRLAVIHMDGNNMGQGIRELMKNQHDYATAVQMSRKISNDIAQGYKKAFECVEQTKKYENQYRKVIFAGDDICFITKAEIAFDFVHDFIKEAEKNSMCGQPFRLCAGIVFIHNHFPFSVAYDMSEELCSLAKQKAKLPENLVNNKAQSYVDFHISLSGVVSNVEEIRKLQYVNRNGNPLCLRPYLVDDTKDQDPTIVTFGKFLKEVKKYHCEAAQGVIARNKLKKLRDTYYTTSANVKSLIQQINSRLEPNDRLENESGFVKVNNSSIEVAYYYDIVDCLDYVAERNNQYD